MKSPEFFDPNKIEEEEDLTLPHFRFTGAERQEMLDKGMTEGEINAKESLANERLARNQIDRELDQAA